jgi:hypothetical protein
MVFFMGYPMAHPDSIKEIALIALKASGGDVETAARYAGVHPRTVRHWSKGTGIHAELGISAEVKALELAEKLEKLAHRIIDTIDDDIILDSNLLQRMTSMGIATDKMRLLRGQPTSITNDYSQLPDDELRQRIAALENGISEEAGTEGTENSISE